MRLILVGVVAATLVGGVGIRMAFATGRARTAAARRRHLATSHVLGSAVAAVLLLTLVPTGGRNDRQLRPFTDIWPALTHPLEPSLTLGVVGNLLLFAPLGAALFLRRWPLLHSVGLGLGMSASIELAQLLVPGRTTSVDDVLLNTSGAGLGWAVAAALYSSAIGQPTTSASPSSGSSSP
jgi:VanZ family protein